MGDREGENFTAAGEAGGADEKEANETTAIDEAVEEEEVGRITADEEGVAIAKSEYLAKTFSTALVIIAFNS